MSRLDELEAFVKVVDVGSFSGAARALGVSKSHVSKTIARLEDRLGARVLNRTTRSLSLTNAGQVLHSRAAAALENLEEAELKVAELQSRPRGTLRMTGPLTFGTKYLVTAVADFMAGYPELTIELTLLDRFVDLVEEGYDLAVRVGDLSDSSLRARRICQVRRLLCASPSYLAAAGAPQSVAELAHHHCLLYTYVETVWRLTVGHRIQSVKVTGPLHANNGDALRTAAVRGLGITLLPDFIVAEDIRAGRLVEVIDGVTGGEAGVWAVYPPGPYTPVKVRLVVDFLADRFGESPDWSDLV